MKNSIIWSIMKKSKALYLTVVNGEQWCSDGRQAYNISSLPELTPEQFIAMIGVETGKSAEYNCRSNDNIDTAIYPESDNYIEEEAEPCLINICSANGELVPLFAFGEVCFIPAESLKPFSDDAAELRFFVRKQGDVYSIVIKIGMLQVGIVMPVKISTFIIDAVSRLHDALTAEDQISEADVPY